MAKYAVIVENDTSEYNDETGTIYHFPNKYLKILEPDTKVIYCKEKVKNEKFKNSRLPKKPNYFGIATIGELRQDIEKIRNIYSEILDYIPFSEAVSFKDKSSNYFKIIPEKKLRITGEMV